MHVEEEALGAGRHVGPGDGRGQAFASRNIGRGLRVFDRKHAAVGESCNGHRHGGRWRSFPGGRLRGEERSGGKKKCEWQKQSHGSILARRMLDSADQSYPPFPAVACPQSSHVA